MDTQHTERITLFVDVILPLPIPKLFTYRIPFEMNAMVKIGCRVIVQFGNKKILTAVIARVHEEPPKVYQAKYVLEILDESPLINPKQIEVFEWMAYYYMCPVGEVLNAALPSGLKISSQSKIQLNPNAVIESLDLNEKEYRLIEALQRNQSLGYNDAAVILEVKNIYHIIKSLADKEAIIIYEEIRDRYQPKKVKKIRLTRDYLDKPDLEHLFKELEKRPKQLDILLGYLRNVPVFKNWTLNEQGLEKSTFTSDEQYSESALSTLIKNEIFEEFEIIVSRFAEMKPVPYHKVDLTPYQHTAVDRIMELFQEKDTVLLQGITGSGKTEIYIELIQKVLGSGSQVLYLLPEIALTTQIVARLRKIFGDKMGVYHSKFSDNERVEVWKGAVTGKFSFVVGVRSSIFLPFDNLGLIIVDEEHETSYKQHEPAPRYNARDMALVIAQSQQAKVLLGSATPSIETFYHAQTGKYGFVQLTQRYGSAQLPTIELIDLRVARRVKKLKGSFSTTLLDLLKDNLDKKEQTILFQNRRGYSPYVTCYDCAWIPKCENCAVSLTYHMYSQELRCHYCGHKEKIPSNCAACGSTQIKTVGFGTEKLEDELKILLPEARTQRMDLDTTRKKNSYQQIINDFENAAIDILVGTQMVSKGLDFDKVSLVGIFDADRMLYFADFRSHEKAFQMLTQVSGRAGRREKQGRVVIQTSNTQHPILHKVIAHDYQGLYDYEIAERERYLYPPFTRLIKLIIKHTEKELSQKAAEQLAEKLKTQIGEHRILGPESPLIDKIRNQYLKNILIKLEKEKINLRAVKEVILQEVQTFSLLSEFKGIQIVIDVDPV